jgi:hypothetical protein
MDALKEESLYETVSMKTWIMAILCVIIISFGFSLIIRYKE